MFPCSFLSYSHCRRPTPFLPYSILVHFSKSFFFFPLFISLSWPLSFHPLCIFLCSLSSCHILPTLSPLLFFLSALLLSSSSHAPVEEYNAVAMAGLCCVCICDVTEQQLYSISSFLIPVLTDFMAILRFINLSKEAATCLSTVIVWRHFVFIFWFLFREIIVLRRKLLNIQLPIKKGIALYKGVAVCLNDLLCVCYEGWVCDI